LWDERAQKQAKLGAEWEYKTGLSCFQTAPFSYVGSALLKVLLEEHLLEDWASHPKRKRPDINKQSGQKITAKNFVIFGNLAVVVIGMTVDPWLCVPSFRWVCLYRMVSLT